MAGSMEERQVGYGFNPTDEHLVDHYLKKKLKGETEADCAIPELYIYNWEPPDSFTLHDVLSSEPSGGRQCFPRGRKRKTQQGFWKGTGLKHVIQAPGSDKPVGTKRYLVYHEGRQPKGHTSDVVMYEYHLNLDTSDSEISDTSAWVLCRIIDRERKKAKSAVVSTSSDLSGLSNLNPAQGTPGVTIESDYPITKLDTGFPNQDVPIPDQQPQMCNDQQSSYGDNGHVDGPTDASYYMPYSPSDGIDLMDLVSFDNITRETQMCEKQCSAYDDNRRIDGRRDGCCDMPCSPSDGIDLEDLLNSDYNED